MLYFPTALIVEQLPAGLASVGQVPALQDMPAKSHAAKVKLYAAAIQKLSKVYATAEHKVRTKAEYDAYMIWLDAWSRLQGFGALVVVDEEVRAAPCNLRWSARRDGCGGGRARTFAFAARHVLVPGHGSPLARPSVARSLGPVKTPPPYTHYPGPYVPRYS